MWGAEKEGADRAPVQAATRQDLREVGGFTGNDAFRNSFKRPRISKGMKNIFVCFVSTWNLECSDRMLVGGCTYDVAGAGL